MENQLSFNIANRNQITKNHIHNLKTKYYGN